jgi:hypothetical protein
MTEPAPEIGWKILDPDGNVVDSGGVSIAHLTADTVEALQEFVANINTEG